MAGRLHCRGFTLTELLITIAIVAIVLGLGAPSFQQSILNGTINSAQSSLLNDLNFARTAAVKSRTRVMVCPRSSETTCGTDWSNGWLVYEDNNRAGTAFDLDSGELVLRTKNASDLKDKEIDVESTIRSQSTSAVLELNQFAFESRGRSGVSGLLVFCDSRGVDNARTIVITATGSLRTALARNIAGNQVDPWGEALQCS